MFGCLAKTVKIKFDCRKENLLSTILNNKLFKTFPSILFQRSIKIAKTLESLLHEVKQYLKQRRQIGISF